MEILKLTKEQSEKIKKIIKEGNKIKESKLVKDWFDDSIQYVSVSKKNKSFVTEICKGNLCVKPKRMF